MRNFLTATTMLTLGLVLSACSTGEPTFGERLQTQGAGLAEIGTNWSKGTEKVREGEKLIARGEDRVRDGERDISRGERLIREGNAMVDRAENRYGQQAGATPD